MSARLYWTVQDSSGNAQAGITVTVHDNTTDTLIATMTNVGDGSYYADLSSTAKIKVKENGTVKLSNYWHVADDIPLLSTLYGPGGAGLIRFDNTTARYSTDVLQTALVDDIAVLSELASTAVNLGASLIGLQDSGGYFTAGTVEGALAELGVIKGLLTGLTANAAELNRLDGVGSDVTAVNLTSLVTQLPTNLHYHDEQSWYAAKIGTSFPTFLGTYDFEVFAGLQAALDTRGNIIFNVQGFGSDGQVLVKKTVGGIAQTFEVVDRSVLGSMNLSSNSIFAGISTVTDALLLLAVLANTVALQTGINYTVFDSGGATATAADGATAADPRATDLYYEKGSTYLKKRRWAVVQQPGMRTIELAGYWKGDAAGVTFVKLVVGGVEQEYKIPGTAYAQTTLSVLLDSIAVDVPTPLDVEIQMKGDGAGNGAKMAQWFQLRATY